MSHFTDDYLDQVSAVLHNAEHSIRLGAIM